ncbi:hypothetical protein I317_00433 [Kwoniella heveanensis CBS 569]|nr:hypothetical protein I317_00433 [Kwoniella heveanensis CBS 569]
MCFLTFDPVYLAFLPLGMILLGICFMVLATLASIYFVLCARPPSKRPRHFSDLLGVGVPLLDGDCPKLFTVRRRHRGRLVLERLFALSLAQRRKRLKLLHQRRINIINAPSLFSTQIMIKDLQGRTRCHIAGLGEVASEFLSRIGYESEFLRSAVYALASGRPLDLTRKISQLPHDTWHLRMRVRGGADFDFDLAMAEWFEALDFDPYEQLPPSPPSPAMSAAEGSTANPILVDEAEDDPQPDFDIIDLEARNAESKEQAKKIPHTLLDALRPLCFKSRALSDQLFTTSWLDFKREILLLQSPTLKDAFADMRRLLSAAVKSLSLRSQSPVYQKAQGRLRNVENHLALSVLEILIGPKPGRIDTSVGPKTIVSWLGEAQFVCPAYAQQFQSYPEIPAPGQPSSSSHDNSGSALSLESYRDWMATQEDRYDKLLADRAELEGLKEVPIGPE